MKAPIEIPDLMDMIYRPAPGDLQHLQMIRSKLPAARAAIARATNALIDSKDLLDRVTAEEAKRLGRMFPPPDRPGD